MKKGPIIAIIVSAIVLIILLVSRQSSQIMRAPINTNDIENQSPEIDFSDDGIDEIIADDAQSNETTTMVVTSSDDEAGDKEFNEAFNATDNVESDSDDFEFNENF